MATDRSNTATRFKRWFDAVRHRGLQGLYSPDQMRQALERERSRSDRTGVCFALLLYEFDIDEPDTRRVRAMVKALRRRLRNTDEIGWLDERRLGVVLLDATADGAWRVADDIRAAWPTDLEPPATEIFTYPEPPRGFDGSDDDPPASPPDDRSAKSMQALFALGLPTWKRGLDVIGASLALALFSPVMLGAAVAVRLDSPGGALFKQQRAGLGGRAFTIYKFRTMTTDAETRKAKLRGLSEQDGPAFKLTNDPRVTRVGNFLRKTSIDELPQLWNVLRGDMSLVGPRPLPVEESNGCDHWQLRRLDVTPGLTCIWQVHGRSRVSFSEWMRMDLAYVRSRGLWRDLVLLAQTVPSVVLRRGAK